MQVAGFMVLGSGCRVQGARFGVSGLEFGVSAVRMGSTIEKQFQGGLVLKARRLFYHSTLRREY